MKKETLVTRLFIGKHDFAAQRKHAKKCEKEGWYVADDLCDPIYHEAVKNVHGAIVVIHGADAGACVPVAAAHALSKGAKRVVIPLNRIKTKNEVCAPLSIRAQKLFSMFKQFEANNGDVDKLIVTPTRIWKEVKSTRK